MKFKVSKPLEEATFDLTPMIDVVLLLIIFFMLTTHFTRSQRAPMDLPREKGRAAAQEPAKSEIVIDLERSGTMKVLREPITLDRLSEMLRSQPGGLAQARLVVRADRACQAAHLNQLAGALLTLGVRDWRLATGGPEMAGSPGGPAAGGGS